MPKSAVQEELERLRTENEALKSGKKSTSDFLPTGDILELVSVEVAHTILMSMEHAHGNHLNEVFLLADKSYSWSRGSEHGKTVKLDPKDAKDAAAISKGYRQKFLKLPGEYVGGVKVEYRITREDILKSKEDIEAEWEKYLVALDEAEAKKAGSRPNATARMFAEALKTVK